MPGASVARRRQRGYTLAELMLVSVAILTASTLALAGMTQINRSQRQGALERDFEVVVQAIHKNVSTSTAALSVPLIINDVPDRMRATATTLVNSQGTALSVLNTSIGGVLNNMLRVESTGISRANCRWLVLRLAERYPLVRVNSYSVRDDFVNPRMVASEARATTGCSSANGNTVSITDYLR